MSFEYVGEWEFHAPIVVQPKQRARVTRNGRSYTPAATARSSNEIRAAIQAEIDQGKLKIPKDVDIVSIDLRFLEVRPASHWTKTGLTKAAKKRFLPRGDVDNRAKTVLDALNGLLYSDDSMVWKLNCRQEYKLNKLDKVPSLEILIIWLKAT